MGEIISLDKKLKLSEDKKAELKKRRKILAVQKVFQCTQCAFKCERCGTQIRPDPDRKKKCEHQYQRVPYQFCESCEAEYLDYIDRLKGGGDQENYWHNDEWLGLWKVWIEYQSAIDSYMKSREFKQLLQEIKQMEPGPSES